MENLLNITAPRTETFPVFLMFRFTPPPPELSENQLITVYFVPEALRRKGTVKAGAAQPSACKILVAYTYIYTYSVALLTNLPESVPEVPGSFPVDGKAKKLLRDAFPSLGKRKNCFGTLSHHRESKKTPSGTLSRYRESKKTPSGRFPIIGKASRNPRRRQPN
ncbi:MAG: hypothetical protein LBN98_02910 [Prevotellaceae bacterium]|jgi:hypothetical protein|nr:hypothetical protein [Prevotellaceae bacterium]